MRAYRSFLLFSLCAHILILAFAATLLISPLSSSRHTLQVTIFQKPIPLPIGEPGGPPGTGEPPAPSAPPPEVRDTPQLRPPSKPRKKPASRPKPPVARKLPALEPSLPAEAPTTPEIGLQSGDNSNVSTGNAETFTTEGGMGEGAEEPGGSRKGTGSGGTGSGGGGALARPDYGVNPKPPYPLIARRIGAQGVVVLRVFVHANGTVGNVIVSQSSGFTVLDESASKTVRERWRFLPARLDGQPVESWVEVPIRFVLADS